MIMSLAIDKKRGDKDRNLAPARARTPTGYGYVYIISYSAENTVEEFKISRSSTYSTVVWIQRVCK